MSADLQRLSRNVPPEILAICELTIKKLRANRRCIDYFALSQELAHHKQLFRTHRLNYIQVPIVAFIYYVDSLFRRFFISVNLVSGFMGPRDIVRLFLDSKLCKVNENTIKTVMGDLIDHPCLREIFSIPTQPQYVPASDILEQYLLNTTLYNEMKVNDVIRDAASKHGLPTPNVVTLKRDIPANVIVHGAFKSSFERYIEKINRKIEKSLESSQRSTATAAVAPQVVPEVLISEEDLRHRLVAQVSSTVDSTFADFLVSHTQCSLSSYFKKDITSQLQGWEDVVFVELRKHLRSQDDNFIKTLWNSKVKDLSQMEKAFDSFDILVAKLLVNSNFNFPGLSGFLRQKIPGSLQTLLTRVSEPDGIADVYREWSLGVPSLEKTWMDSPSVMLFKRELLPTVEAVAVDSARMLALTDLRKLRSFSEIFSGIRWYQKYEAILGDLLTFLSENNELKGFRFLVFDLQTVLKVPTEEELDSNDSSEYVDVLCRCFYPFWNGTTNNSISLLLRDSLQSLDSSLSILHFIPIALRPTFGVFMLPYVLLHCLSVRSSEIVKVYEVNLSRSDRILSLCDSLSDCLLLQELIGYILERDFDAEGYVKRVEGLSEYFSDDLDLKNTLIDIKKLLDDITSDRTEGFSSPLQSVLQSQRQKLESENSVLRARILELERTNSEIKQLMSTSNLVSAESSGMSVPSSLDHAIHSSTSLTKSSESLSTDSSVPEVEGKVDLRFAPVSGQSIADLLKDSLGEKADHLPLSLNEAKYTVEVLHNMWMRDNGEGAKSSVKSVPLLGSNLYTEIGHFIYEFVQNGEDNVYTLTSDKLPMISFKVDDNILHYSSNERGFRHKDVISICRAGSSTKINTGAIGKKGIGFKSLFAVTDEITISSNFFKFKFDKRPEPLGYGDKGILMPRWIESPRNSFTEGTSFDIVLSAKTRDTVVDRLHGLKKFPFILLFLRHLRSIDVKSTEGNTVFTRLDTMTLLPPTEVDFPSVLATQANISDAPTAATVSLELAQILITNEIPQRKESFKDIASVTMESLRLGDGHTQSVDAPPRVSQLLLLRLCVPIPPSLATEETHHFSSKDFTEMVIGIPLGELALDLELNPPEGYLEDALRQLLNQQLSGRGSSVSDHPVQPVFCFLPVSTAYGFRFVLQADWVLPSTRESLSHDHSRNIWLARTVLPFALLSLLDQFTQLCTARRLSRTLAVAGLNHILSLLPYSAVVADQTSPFKTLYNSLCELLPSAPILPSSSFSSRIGDTEEYNYFDRFIPPQRALMSPADVDVDEKLYSIGIKHGALFEYLNLEPLYRSLVVPPSLQKIIRLPRLSVVHVGQLIQSQYTESRSNPEVNSRFNFEHLLDLLLTLRDDDAAFTEFVNYIRSVPMVPCISTSRGKYIASLEQPVFLAPQEQQGPLLASVPHSGCVPIDRVALHGLHNFMHCLDTSDLPLNTERLRILSHLGIRPGSLSALADVCISVFSTFQHYQKTDPGSSLTRLLRSMLPEAVLTACFVAERTSQPPTPEEKAMLQKLSKSMIVPTTRNAVRPPPDVLLPLGWLPSANSLDAAVHIVEPLVECFDYKGKVGYLRTTPNELPPLPGSDPSPFAPTARAQQVRAKFGRKIVPPAAVPAPQAPPTRNEPTSTIEMPRKGALRLGFNQLFANDRVSINDHRESVRSSVAELLKTSTKPDVVVAILRLLHKSLNQNDLAFIMENLKSDIHISLSDDEVVSLEMVHAQSVRENFVRKIPEGIYKGMSRMEIDAFEEEIGLKTSLSPESAYKFLELVATSSGNSASTSKKYAVPKKWFLLAHSTGYMLQVDVPTPKNYSDFVGRSIDPVSFNRSLSSVKLIADREIVKNLIMRAVKYATDNDLPLPLVLPTDVTVIEGSNTIPNTMLSLPAILHAQARNQSEIVRTFIESPTSESIQSSSRANLKLYNVSLGFRSNSLIVEDYAYGNLRAMGLWSAWSLPDLHSCYYEASKKYSRERLEDGRLAEVHMVEEVFKRFKAHCYDPIGLVPAKLAMEISQFTLDGIVLRAYQKNAGRREAKPAEDDKDRLKFFYTNLKGPVLLPCLIPTARIVDSVASSDSSGSLKLFPYPSEFSFTDSDEMNSKELVWQLTPCLINPDEILTSSGGKQHPTFISLTSSSKSICFNTLEAAKLGLPILEHTTISDSNFSDLKLTLSSYADMGNRDNFHDQHSSSSVRNESAAADAFTLLHRCAADRSRVARTSAGTLFNPDVILIDVHTSQDGYQLASWLKGRCEAIPSFDLILSFSSLPSRVRHLRAQEMFVSAHSLFCLQEHISLSKLMASESLARLKNGNVESLVKGGQQQKVENLKNAQDLMLRVGQSVDSSPNEVFDFEATIVEDWPQMQLSKAEYLDDSQSSAASLPQFLQPVDTRLSSPFVTFSPVGSFCFYGGKYYDGLRGRGGSSVMNHVSSISPTYFLAATIVSSGEVRNVWQQYIASILRASTAILYNSHVQQVQIDEVVEKVSDSVVQALSNSLKAPAHIALRKSSSIASIDDGFLCWAPNRALNRRILSEQRNEGVEREQQKKVKKNDIITLEDEDVERLSDQIEATLAISKDADLIITPTDSKEIREQKEEKVRKVLRRGVVLRTVSLVNEMQNEPDDVSTKAAFEAMESAQLKEEFMKTPSLLSQVQEILDQSLVRPIPSEDLNLLTRLESLVDDKDVEHMNEEFATEKEQAESVVIQYEEVVDKQSDRKALLPFSQQKLKVIGAEPFGWTGSRGYKQGTGGTSNQFQDVGPFSVDGPSLNPYSAPTTTSINESENTEEDVDDTFCGGPDVQMLAFQSVNHNLPSTQFTPVPIPKPVKIEALNDMRGWSLSAEASVWKYLKEMYPECIVTWLNHNQESGSPYDIVMTWPPRLGGMTELYEVKLAGQSLSSIYASWRELDEFRDRGKNMKLAIVYSYAGSYYLSIVDDVTKSFNVHLVPKS